MLPFLLGIFGLYYQYKKNNKDAWAVTLFFLLTGLAIVVYTNHKPYEPRNETTRLLAPSMPTPSGLELVRWALGHIAYKNEPYGSLLPCDWSYYGCVPVRMAAENWDDHDRSNRYTARDIAKAYLDSCEPNAILFTNGDNDTFPLWYVQEVEGYEQMLGL